MWGVVSLHGMLDISEEMRLFVNDYKMMLVEVRQNNLTFHNINNVDFFNMLEMVIDKSISKNEAKEKIIKCPQEHIDKSVVMMVAGATNCVNHWSFQTLISSVSN